MTARRTIDVVQLAAAVEHVRRTGELCQFIDAIPAALSDKDRQFLRAKKVPMGRPRNKELAKDIVSAKSLYAAFRKAGRKTAWAKREVTIRFPSIARRIDMIASGDDPILRRELSTIHPSKS